MSEELLSNDRRIKKFISTGIRNINFPLHNLIHWPLRYQARNSNLLKRFYISNKLYSEWEQSRSLINEELKREKVTWEVKECSRRKVQNVKRKFA